MRDASHSTRDAGKTMEPSSGHWDKVWEKTRVLAPHDTVLATIAKLNVSAVVEVGAGSGRDLEELHRRGHDVVFADFSPGAVHRFSRRNPDVPAMFVDCRRLPFRDDSSSIKNMFLKSHTLFAKGVAGSLGIVVEKTRS